MKTPSKRKSHVDHRKTIKNIASRISTHWENGTPIVREAKRPAKSRRTRHVLNDLPPTEAVAATVADQTEMNPKPTSVDNPNSAVVPYQPNNLFTQCEACVDAYFNRNSSPENLQAQWQELKNSLAVFTGSPLGIFLSIIDKILLLFIIFLLWTLVKRCSC